MRQSILYSVLVPCLVSPVLWGAQSEDPQPMLEIHSLGLYDWPVADIDLQLIETIKHLKHRLADLTEELELEPFQGQAMAMGWDLCTSATALRFDSNENGIAASFVFEPGNVELESLYSQMTGFIEISGMEMSELSPSSSEVMGPMGPIGIEHNDNRLWLSMGETDIVPMTIDQGDLPDGLTPVMSGRADIGKMINLFAPDLAEMMENEPAFMMNPVMAFMEPDSPVIEFNVGVDDDQMHMTSRLINAAKNSESLGMSTEVFFEKDDFKRVPMDAVRLVAFQTNISQTLGALQTTMESVGSEEYDEFTRELGVDLLEDVLGNMGDRMMYYQSESTGGGGVLSAVLLMELNDAEAFGKAHLKLKNKLNKLAVEEVNGYARVQEWTTKSVKAYSMTAPGLPIPLEPSWAIHEDMLVVALSPGSLEQAVSQLRIQSRRSIIDNPLFKESVLSRAQSEKVYGLSFFDAARLSKKGYGVTAMLSSALANAARSPKNPDRIVGSIMPSFSQLTKNVEPSSSISWWDGEDFRTHYIGDESVLVQLSAGMGAISDVQGVILPAFAAGILLPALGSAREAATEVLAATQLRGIIQGMIVYSSVNEDRFPESMDVMLNEGFIEHEMLISPFGPALDGGPDYLIRSDKAASDNIFDASFILAFDRAAWINGEESILVGFADGHIENVDRFQFMQMLESRINSGAIEIFDIE
ncbi:MAG: hypothetical protein P1U42_01670 [Phycisphaerales bacterium]|nr:hypothetical protein [Phycisphaerales bacterium]